MKKVLINTEFSNPSTYKITNLTSTKRNIKNTIIDNAMTQFVGDINENIAVHGGRKFTVLL